MFVMCMHQNEKDVHSRCSKNWNKYKSYIQPRQRRKITLHPPKILVWILPCSKSESIHVYDYFKVMPLQFLNSQAIQVDDNLGLVPFLFSKSHSIHVNYNCWTYALLVFRVPVNIYVNVFYFYLCPFSSKNPSHYM